MTADPWNEAIREAYASAPVDDIILYTLEFRHPAFVDDDENLVAIRVVFNNEDIDARLESDAPLNSGELVTFQKCAFGCRPPESDTERLPEVDVWIDNVSRKLSRYLEQATAQRAPIELTYREYLYSDLEGGPAHVLNGLTLRKVVADDFRVTGRAGFYDLLNRSWLSTVYRPENFPGLMRQ